MRKMRTRNTPNTENFHAEHDDSEIISQFYINRETYGQVDRHKQIDISMCIFLKILSVRVPQSCFEEIVTAQAMTHKGQLYNHFFFTLGFVAYTLYIKISFNYRSVGKLCSL